MEQWGPLSGKGNHPSHQPPATREGAENTKPEPPLLYGYAHCSTTDGAIFKTFLCCWLCMEVNDGSCVGKSHSYLSAERAFTPP